MIEIFEDDHCFSLLKVECYFLFIETVFASFRFLYNLNEILFCFSDEIDVIGYTSTQSSDTDDHSSVQSASSDSGVAISTSRLTLSEKDIIL